MIIIKANALFSIIFRWAIERVNLMGDNRITGDISTDPLAAKSRTVSADEVKLYFRKIKKKSIRKCSQKLLYNSSIRF